MPYPKKLIDIKKTRYRVKQILIPFIIVLIINLILFYQFFLQNHYIVPSDMLLSYYPWKHINLNSQKQVIVKNCLRSDVIDSFVPNLSFLKSALETQKPKIPLWLPLKVQGKPFATLLFYGLLNPIIGPLILFFDVPTAFSLSIVMKIMVSFLFMYFYLKTLRLPLAPSLIGATIFSLSGFNSVWCSWPHTLVTTFAPLLFLGLEIFLEKKTFKSGLIIPLAIASMILAGFPAVAGYFFYLFAFYVLLRIFQKSPRKKLLTNLSSSCTKIAILTIIGIGITAVQLLPSLEYLSFINISYRRASSLSSLPWSSVIQLILPFYNGNPVFHNWRGLSNFNETSGYTGVLSIIALFLTPLIIFALRKKESLSKKISNTSLFFMATSLITLSIIYKVGPALYLIHNLPVFSTSSSTRLLSVFGFSQAVFTAFFLDTIFHLKVRPSTRIILKKFLLAGLFLIFPVFIYSLSRLHFHYPVAKTAKPFIFSHLPFLRWANLTWLLFQTILFILLILLLVLNKKKIVAFGFLSLVALDLILFNYRQNPTVPKELFYPETPGIKHLKETMKPWERMAPFNSTFMIPGTQLYYGLNSAFAHSFYSQDHKFLISLFSQNAFHTPTAIIPKSESTNFLSPVIDILGIKYIILPPHQNLEVERIPQTKSNKPVGYIWKKRSVVQTFRVKREELKITKICLLMATYKKQLAGKGLIRLKDCQNKVLVEKPFSLDALKDNSWACFNLNSPTLDPGSYKIEIFSLADVNNSFTIWQTSEDLYKDGNVYVHGKPLQGDLAFKIIFSSQELEEKYSLVYQGEDLTIYQNNSASSGVFLAENILYYENREDFKSKIENFFPSKNILLSCRTPIKMPEQKCGVKEVEIIRYAPNSVEYHTKSDCDAILTTPELWYPGWEVSIDGKESELLKTNLIFRGVYVPRGEHIIKFSYKPKSLRLGIIVTSISAALFLKMLFFSFRTKSSS